MDKTTLRFADEALQAAGEFTIKLNGDKFERSYLCNITFSGQILASCDRCLEPVELSVSDSCIVMLSHDSDLAEHEHDDFDDVIQLTEDDIEVDISTVLSECIELAVPMRRVHAAAEECKTFEESGKDTQSLANNEELKKLKKLFNS